MTKAQIKSTGKIVEVTSQFMPKKRNAPSREWMCNLSDGTCISESELEYLKDSLHRVTIKGEELEQLPKGLNKGKI